MESGALSTSNKRQMEVSLVPESLRATCEKVPKGKGIDRIWAYLGDSTQKPLRPPSSSLSYGPGNDDVRSPGSGGTPGPLSQPPGSQQSVDTDPECVEALDDVESTSRDTISGDSSVSRMWPECSIPLNERPTRVCLCECDRPRSNPFLAFLLNLLGISDTDDVPDPPGGSNCQRILRMIKIDKNKDVVSRNYVNHNDSGGDDDDADDVVVVLVVVVVLLVEKTRSPNRNKWKVETNLEK
ncbi:hypothetical protein RUM44_001135 [Polyplax serrata]|uniref:Uncharacterized protein n=1 Tax=Polyplax serrata TaxID=468196 RepID=A0ABR1B9L1_POLSC